MAKTGGIGERGGVAIEIGVAGRAALPAENMPSRKRSAIDGSIEHLTFRECEVLEALLRGLTNKQIGIELDISHRTVEVHRARLMRKLCAPTLAALFSAVLPQRSKLESLVRAQR